MTRAIAVRALASCSAVLLVPARAEAHLVGVELGGFYAGLLHVFSALDYLGVVIGLALWASLQAEDGRAAVLTGACAGLVAGAVIGAMVPDLDQPAVILAAVAILGGLVGAAVRLTYLSALLAGSLLSLPLGLSNGGAVVQGVVNLPLFVGGVAAGGILSITLSTAAFSATGDRFAVGLLGARILGGWLAAFGTIGLAIGILGVAA